MTTAALHPGFRPAKYLAVARTALRQALAERAAIVGRMAFYFVILLIFSQLWYVVGEMGALGELGATEFLWYLALTEWVMLSLTPVHLDIEADVRSGEIAYRLSRPISYLGGRLAEAAGDCALRAVTLGIWGFAMAYLLAGSLPKDPSGLLLALPLGVLALWLGLVSMAAIGVTAFWLQDCSPVYLVWQKAAFILGGLMLPLEIYPDWLRQVADWTPFSAFMYGVGRMSFGFDPVLAGEVALRLVGWSLLTTLLLVWMYRRALRGLEVNGG
ncbi:MAG: ABC transporter permease [Myxococcales bacterium]|nr:ABC transporter permease [Myxococcales bacterium]